MRYPVRPLIAALLFVACSDGSVNPIEPPTGPNNPGGPGTPPPPPPPLSASAQRGKIAFTANCASCHNSADGYDLAYFNYADSTIVRRALGHVDQATSDDIVAYIASIQAPTHNRDERLFQPGGAVLASDAAFGAALFPNGVFPTDLTTTQLRGMNRLSVQVGIALPRWSVEGAITDWLPDVALPASVLTDRSSAPQLAVAAYRSNPTTANLQAVVTAIFSATHRPNSPGPCHFENQGGPANAVECFQVMRWASTLTAQHMLRTGQTQAFSDTIFHTVWWEVGEALRRGRTDPALSQGALANQISWMYLGWMFGADARPSLYMLPALEGAQLWRHATWVAVRGLVDRPAGSLTPYVDVLNIPRYGYDPWLYGALRFAYRHLLERIQAGDIPTTGLSQAKANVSTSYSEASTRSVITAAQRADLQSLSQQVINALP